VVVFGPNHRDGTLLTRVSKGVMIDSKIVSNTNLFFSGSLHCTILYVDSTVGGIHCCVLHVRNMLSDKLYRSRQKGNESCMRGVSDTPGLGWPNCHSLETERSLYLDYSA
jgi:hypothetical protein